MVRKMNEIKSGYRVIIMDCQMPGMDGWEASLAIRKMFDDKEICHLPYIIAYSAFDSYEDIEKCLRSGMISHLSKPCQHEELCKVVSVWMSKPLQKL
jgi:CheY-like chemotaxis protein